MGADGPGSRRSTSRSSRRPRLLRRLGAGATTATSSTRWTRVLSRDDVTELGAVLAGDAEGRQSDDEATVFDSTGLAIQDLAIALAALERADELDLRLVSGPRRPGPRERDRGDRRGSDRGRRACARRRVDRMRSRGRCRGPSTRGDPDAGRSREGSDERARSSVVPQMPAQRCVTRASAEQLGRERFDPPDTTSVTAPRRRSTRRRRPASREPPITRRPIRRLLPVIGAVARVVRTLEQELRQRLGDEHLAARRPDRRVELGNEPVPEPSVATTTRSASRSSSDSTRLPSTSSCAGSAARRASRRTQRAGCSAPSRGCSTAAGKRPPSGGGGRRAIRPRSRPRRARRTRRAAPRVRRRRPRAEGFRPGGTRHPRARPSCVGRPLSVPSMCVPDLCRAVVERRRRASRRRGARSRRSDRSHRPRSRAPRAGARGARPPRARARTSSR